MYRIKAIFKHEEQADKFTIYEEVLFASEEIAVDWLNGDYGELLSQASSLDTESEPDLEGYWLDDLIVEKVEK